MQSLKLQASQVKVGMIFKNYFGWGKITKIEKRKRKNGKVCFDFYYQNPPMMSIYGMAKSRPNMTTKGENTMVYIKGGK
tara:strand:- start:2053 stop:2289 length:237 start_codon:yes stop_codon:yes gene_type:complete